MFGKKTKKQTKPGLGLATTVTAPSKQNLIFSSTKLSNLQQIFMACRVIKE